MKSYEGMFLFKPDITKDNLDKLLKSVQEILTKNKGSSDQVTEWGKRKLSYPIRKYTEAVYYIVNFHIKPESISNVKKTLGLNESILRTLIVEN